MSSRFQVGGCESLPFHPALTASTQGQASKADGTSFDVKVTSRGARAGEHRESRPARSRKRCPRAQLDAPESVPGSGLQRQPRGLPRRLGDRQRDRPHPRPEEPADGPGVPRLATATRRSPTSSSCSRAKASRSSWTARPTSKTAITYSRFESAPDAPFTSFETVLPAGPHGILTRVRHRKATDYNLCTHRPHDADHDHRPGRRRDRTDTPDRHHRLRGVLSNKTASPPGAAARQSPRPPADTNTRPNGRGRSGPPAKPRRASATHPRPRRRPPARPRRRQTPWLARAPRPAPARSSGRCWRRSRRVRQQFERPAREQARSPDLRREPRRGARGQLGARARHLRPRPVGVQRRLPARQDAGKTRVELPEPQLRSDPHRRHPLRDTATARSTAAWNARPAYTCAAGAWLKGPVTSPKLALPGGTHEPSQRARPDPQQRQPLRQGLAHNPQWQARRWQLTEHAKLFTGTLVHPHRRVTPTRSSCKRPAAHPAKSRSPAGTSRPADSARQHDHPASTDACTRRVGSGCRDPSTATTQVVQKTLSGGRGARTGTHANGAARLQTQPRGP